MQYARHKNTLTVTLTGDYITSREDIGQLLSALKKNPPSKVVFNAKKLGKWDSSLLVALYQLVQFGQKENLNIDMNTLPSGLRRLLTIAFAVNRKPPSLDKAKGPFLDRVGVFGLDVARSVGKGCGFIRSVLRSVHRLFTGRATMRRVDFLFALQGAGPDAILIVSLISFMVGLILAFVGVLQLKMFGAQIYISSLVAVGMTRIMGAIMTGIIMAGRTGASYAANIGTMQVNEEIDALRTMGIPPSDFLVLPRMLALVLTMPLLVFLSDIMGVIGGAAVGIFMMDIPVQEYWKYTLNALDMTNFLVGLFHGFVFGIVIALCGCYYGIHSGRNADSVGLATTKAVVTAIVWMIVMTGIITWACEVLNI